MGWGSGGGYYHPLPTPLPTPYNTSNYCADTRADTPWLLLAPVDEYSDWFHTKIYTRVILNTKKRMKKYPFFGVRFSINIYIY